MFEEAETISSSHKTPMATLSYMRPKSRKTGQNKVGSKPQLHITIPTVLCGTSKSDRWVIMIGSKENKGKLRVQGVPKSDKSEKGIEPTQLKHCFRWNFGYVPKLGEDIFDGGHCPIKKISDEVYEISYEGVD